jgi:hypothetical protein
MLVETDLRRVRSTMCANRPTMGRHIPREQVPWVAYERAMCLWNYRFKALNAASRVPD